MSNVDISIIVPVYNVEEYLEECLDSIKNQTKDNIEVIIVDDDSPDGSGEIAKKFEQENPNFHYYHKENGGLGCARNFGVKKAKGKYIAFMDSDDFVSLDLYEKMFNAAEKNNSDLTICNVVRCNSKGAWASNLHVRAFRDIESNTHITKNPSLLNDTISCNKLILRSFYEENNFEFPEKILYEDIPVTIPMHFLANNVSFVESSYYFWRVRDGATKSITQTTDNLVNLHDRIKIMKMLDEFFANYNVSEELMTLKQKKHLEVDLNIFINHVKSLPYETAMEILNIVNKYIDEAIDEKVFGMLSLVLQQKYDYVRALDVDNLVKLLEYQTKDYFNAEITEQDGRFTVALPDDIFRIENRDITNELKENQPVKNVTAVTVSKEKVQISGYVYHRRVNISNPNEQKITAYLQNELTGELTRLDVEQEIDDTVSKLEGVYFDSKTQRYHSYNYDGVSFNICIDLNTFEINEKNVGYNRVLVVYENRVAKGRVWLSAKRKILPNNAVLLNDSYIKIEYDEVKELRILLGKETNIAKSVIADGKDIIVSVEKKVDGMFAQGDDGKRIEFATSDGTVFCSEKENFKRDSIYNLYIEENGIIRNLLFETKKIMAFGDNYPSVVCMTNKNHEVRFVVKDSITSLLSMKQRKRVVSLSTSVAINSSLKKATSSYIYVYDELSGKREIFAKAKCKKENNHLHCSYNIDFNDSNRTKNLYSGMRDVFVCYLDGKNEIQSDKIYSSKYYKNTISFDTFEVSLYRGNDGFIRLKSANIWREEENTVQKRKLLLSENYPKYCQEQIDPMLIVFESKWGKNYSCNPQYIYEYIDKHYPQYKCVWALNDERTPIKGNGIRVRRGSQEYYHYLFTAKYLFNNVNFPDEYIKREGQIEVQTMHGTPLKTFGLEVPGELVTQASREAYIKKNERWNYLIVQGEFMKNKAYDCFNFSKTILECGYPRTDMLFNVSEDEKNRLKKQLNIPIDKKVILYTPTWRKKGVFDMVLEIEKMRKHLSEEYVLLVRLHYFSKPDDSFVADNKFVFDFNSYRSVEDLYLITDVLITDYSSVMFDFALLDKPMIFFTYDLADYRDNLRGMYFDIEKEAPGPLVFNTNEIISVIQNIDEEMKKYQDNIIAFHKKYLTYENGDSCSKIVETVIAPEKYKKTKSSTIKTFFKKILKH